jgi:hypothetical protein
MDASSSTDCGERNASNSPRRSPRERRGSTGGFVGMLVVRTTLQMNYTGVITRA